MMLSKPCHYLWVQNQESPDWQLSPFHCNKTVCLQVWRQMRDKTGTQDGWGEATNLPPGAAQQHQEWSKEETDHEVQTGHEEDEEILSRETVSESGHGTGEKVCRHGETSWRKAWSEEMCFPPQNNVPTCCWNEMQESEKKDVQLHRQQQCVAQGEWWETVLLRIMKWNCEIRSLPRSDRFHCDINNQFCVSFPSLISNNTFCPSHK